MTRSDDEGATTQSGVVRLSPFVLIDALPRPAVHGNNIRSAPATFVIKERTSYMYAVCMCVCMLYTRNYIRVCIPIIHVLEVCIYSSIYFLYV